MNPYEIHVDRLINTLPEHEDLFRATLLNKEFISQMRMWLEMKSDQASQDGEYHNSIIGRKIDGIETPSFMVFEIGCTPSIDRFRHYWDRLGYDSYNDYATGILYNDGKGFNIYENLTDNQLPEEIDDAFVKQFFSGHILRVLEEELLLMSAAWLGAGEKTFVVYPPELQ